MRAIPSLRDIGIIAEGLARNPSALDLVFVQKEPRKEVFHALLE